MCIHQCHIKYKHPFLTRARRRPTARAGRGFAASQPHTNPRARGKGLEEVPLPNPPVLDGPESYDGPYQNWGLFKEITSQWNNFRLSINQTFLYSTNAELGSDGLITTTAEQEKLPVPA